jgi:hypothetical protein
MRGDSVQLSASLTLGDDHTFGLYYSIATAKARRPTFPTLNFRDNGKWSVNDGQLILDGVGMAGSVAIGDKMGVRIAFTEVNDFSPNLPSLPKGAMFDLAGDWHEGGRDKAMPPPPIRDYCKRFNRASNGRKLSPARTRSALAIAFLGIVVHGRTYFESIIAPNNRGDLCSSERSRGKAIR